MGELHKGTVRLNGVIVAISGPPGSGKTALARRLAERLDAPLISFGDHVRALASAMGASTERESLQDIGEAEVERDVDHFVASALASAAIEPGGVIILDGVRHKAVWLALRSHAAAIGARAYLLSIAVPKGARWQRLQQRGISEPEIRQLESHRSETDVARSLPRLADLRLDGSGSVEALADGVASWLQHRPNDRGQSATTRP